MPSPRVPSVLIVDDEPEVRARICESLVAASFHCVGADGAGHAIDLVQRTAVDVALLEISGGKPGETVWLARRLREQVRDLAVVAVCARHGLDTAIEAMRIGAIDYLSKPCTSAELVDAVDRAVEWRWKAMESQAGHDQEIAARTARLARALADSAIASSPALDAWLTVVYHSDREALAHAQRVARISSAVARMLGLDEATVGHIDRAALLHDIGRLALPPALASSPVPLTADEAASLRRHVQAAFEIAASTPFLEPAADIVIATRERYDGSGYPRGLQGGAIPIGARIIAVAEAIDALSPRPPSLALTLTGAADAELIRGAGLLFDPDVVMASLRCAEVGALSADAIDPRGRQT